MEKMNVKPAEGKLGILVVGCGAAFDTRDYINIEVVCQKRFIISFIRTNQTINLQETVLTFSRTDTNVRYFCRQQSLRCHARLLRCVPVATQRVAKPCFVVGVSHFSANQRGGAELYPLFDINIVKGQGCKVWDDKGQEYLDLYGGHAVISIGHCHPHYVEMLTNQLNNLGFYSNSVINKLQVKLAERLGKISGYEDYQFFLINSGAEANENALKLASFTNGRTRVLSIEKAFHGRTSLAVEVTNNPKIIAPINDNGHVTVIIRCVMGCVKRPHSFYGCKDSNKFFKKEKNFRFYFVF